MYTQKWISLRGAAEVVHGVERGQRIKNTVDFYVAVEELTQPLRDGAIKARWRRSRKPVPEHYWDDAALNPVHLTTPDRSEIESCVEDLLNIWAIPHNMSGLLRPADSDKTAEQNPPTPDILPEQHMIERTANDSVQQDTVAERPQDKRRLTLVSEKPETRGRPADETNRVLAALREKYPDPADLKAQRASKKITEEALANEFNTSRTTIRAALKRFFENVHK